MSTAPPSIPTILPPFIGDGDSPPRLTVAEYHRLAAEGKLTDDGVELLEGLLVKKMPKNPRHVLVLKRLSRLLEKMLSHRFGMRVQDPITLSGSEPEPDLVVVRGKEEEFEERHPGPGDVAMVIEVSETTLRLDRGVKKRLYAEARLPIYWIVNLIDNQIEILTEPSGPAEKPDYAKREIVEISSALPLIIDGKQLGILAAKDILG
jgi:Uma2 family endonuclease